MLEIGNVFLSSLIHLFTWSTFSLMLLGIVIGFIVGILPGLGASTALVLMLPFIVKMNPFEAFAFLLGMHSVCNTTGNITSILFGIPGEPTTVATIVDGHPMAKRGEAGRALGAVLMSSLIGAMFGAFSLAVAIPIVRPVILTFGSPEFFMLALLGITFVASLSSGALLKGLISGGIGLYLATIGLDPMTGIQRFTFGQTFLWDGVGLVPIALGFFAIPELIDLYVQGTSIAREKVDKVGGVMEGIKEAFRRWWLVIRCSAIGTYIGIIPGMGGAVTQWLAYAHAVQGSRDKEQVGKGAIEGVLGPGAAENSTQGGHLITTVAFGVPGSVGMAILMGAFLIQGIVPGPDMLIPEVRGGHLALTFSFVWINVVSNIITVGICFLLLNQLVKITQIRGNLLIPIILLLIYLGAFADKNAFPDLILLLVFGLLGWGMLQLKWPRPPLLLGLVLGPLVENRLFLSVGRYDLSWLLRPWVLLILLLMLIGISYPALRTMWQKRKGGKIEPSLAPSGVVHDGRAVLRIGPEAAFGLFIVVVFVIALWQSRLFNIRAGLFPWVIGSLVLGLSIVQLIRDLMGKGNGRDKDSLGQVEPELPADIVSRRTAAISVWILGFFAAIWLIGLSVATPVCSLIYLKRAQERWPITLLMSAGAWALMYGLFERALHIPLPKGLLFGWL